MEDFGRYQNGKIYKLVNSVDDKIYIGSTCSTLAKRKSAHKGTCKREIGRRVYAHLSTIGWDKIDIVLIESFPCNSKEELFKREHYWIDTLKPQLNKEGVQEFIKNPKKQVYYREHEEEIKQRSKIRRQIKNVCECGGKFSLDHKKLHERSNIHKIYLKK